MRGSPAVAAALLAAVLQGLHVGGAAAPAVSSTASRRSLQMAPRFRGGCPGGMFTIRSAADRQRALDSGRHAFRWHIQEFCQKMPLYVMEPLRFGLRESCRLPVPAAVGWPACRCSFCAETCRLLQNSPQLDDS